MNEVVLSLLLLLGGLVALVGGGEFLVRGASGLASAARISPLVIGLTVVAFGTSSPELAVSFKASYAGQADLALGNVIGSNIFNVLFILGISALLVPLVVSSQLIRIEVPLMIGASVLMLLLGLDGTIGRWDGCLLFAILIIYTVSSILQSRKEQAAVQKEFEEAYGSSPKLSRRDLVMQCGFIVVGLVLLGFGANWLVEGAVLLARRWGMPELVIGLTIIAIGTSLPEVAASILASVRGERDIAVGNVVGSNLFNIFGVLGLSAAVAPAGVSVPPTALQFDLPVMIAVAVACLPIFFTGHLIARWEGAVFFGYYLAYTALLVLSVTWPVASRNVGIAMLTFVLPLTVITLAVTVWRALRERQIDG